MKAGAALEWLLMFLDPSPPLLAMSASEQLQVQRPPDQSCLLKREESSESTRASFNQDADELRWQVSAVNEVWGVSWQFKKKHSVLES